MTNTLPKDNKSNGWIVYNKENIPVMETFREETAQRCLDLGFKVLTTYEHLRRLNKQIKEDKTLC